MYQLISFLIVVLNHYSQKAAMGKFYHFLFHLYCKIYTNSGKYNPFPVLENVINTGNVDRAWLEILETAAVAIFAVKSKSWVT